MLRLMPWGFDLKERTPMGRYREIVDNLRNLYVVHVSSRYKVDNDTLIQLTDTEFVQSKMYETLVTELKPFVRKFVSEDPRTRSTIYESDLFIVVDPSGFFKQLDDELEAAYQYGLKTGKGVAVMHRIVDEANNGS